MPLTHEERAFLDAYVYEATNGPPFGGPATRDLQQRGIYYPDLSWILTAYQRELCAEGKIPAGVRNTSPPPSPWKNLEDATSRNAQLQSESEIGTLPGRSENRAPLWSDEELQEAERILAEQKHLGKPLAEVWRDIKAREAAQ